MKAYEIINKTTEGIVIFFSVKKKDPSMGGGQILVPDVGPSLNYLN